MKPHRLILITAALLILVVLPLSYPSPHAHAPVVSARAQAARAPYDIQIPILAYHKIDLTTPSEWFVAADEFARQMDALKAYGYDTISLYDYMNYVDGIGKPPEKPIIITFDDGFEGVYKYAIPILSQRGMSAMLFMITGKLGESETGRANNQDWQSLEPKTNHMIWPETFAAYGDGFFIESHTVNHYALDASNAGAWFNQINSSRGRLRSRMPTNPVDFFAYPYGVGAHDPDVRSLIQEAGYRAAVSFDVDDDIANPSTSDLWALPRRHILSGHSLELDPSDPWWFFMRRVDPEFPLPNPAVSPSVVVSDRAGNTARTSFYSGEPLTMTLKVSNYGSPVPAVASLDLLAAGETVYRGHEQYPRTDVYTPTLKTGNRTNVFTYTLQAPQVAAPEPVSYTLSLRDPSLLLGYYVSPPAPVFTVQPYPISVSVSPLPLELQPGEEKELVFTVDHPGVGAAEMYLTVSLSGSLEIVQTLPQEKWFSYPPGSYVKANGCSKACITTTDRIYEAREPAFGSGSKTYRLRVRLKPGEPGPHWLRYQLAMNVPDSLLPGQLRAPLTGSPDQQGYASSYILVGTPTYLPLIYR